MVKNLMQDIIPPSHRSIRHITLAGKSSGRNVKEAPKIRRPRQGGLGVSISLWAFGLVVLLALVFGASSLFTSATVKVQPKTSAVQVNLNIIAKKAPTDGELSFHYAIVNKTLSETVPATGTAFEEIKALGRIIIYNNWSAQSQRLVKNTRFETPAGLIYRIDQSVTVPGRSTVGGKTTPGSVEVIVYADQPGPKYNIGLTDFTVPGFKTDTARYQNFYARSKTPMTGGFSGEVKKVSSEVLEATRKSLRQNLGSEAMKEASEKFPESTVFFGGSLYSEFLSIPATEEGIGGGATAVVAESASTTVVFFDEKELSSYIAGKVLNGYNGDPVVINNFRDLIYTSLDKEGLNPAGADSISFNIKGLATFVWTYSESDLKKDLAGRSKKNIGQVLSKYSAIIKTEAIVRPFWRSTFPKNPEKIYIQNLEKTTETSGANPDNS